jgi:hypothetical protein
MAEIEKIAVYDPRIIQEPARYAVQQGALSVSTAQFQATSATTSNLSFQVLVPSLNVFIDRKIELNTGVTVYAEAVPSQSLASYKGSAANAILTVLQTDDTGENLTKPEQPPFVSVQSTPSIIGARSQNTAAVLPEGSFTGQAKAGIQSNFNRVPSNDGATPANNYYCGLATYMPIGISQDLYLSMFPVQTLVNSMTVTVNDCSISLTGDTLKEQLLLAQTRDSIQQRTCPSKFDIYAYPRDDALATNGNGQSYGQARDSDIPNGSWPIVFLNPSDGTPLPRFGSYPIDSKNPTGIRVPVINWRPCFIPAYSSLQESTDPSFGGVFGCSDVSVPYPVMFRYQSVEPLAISPFLWQDSKQMSEVGLYGITNMTISMNLNNAGASQGYQALSPLISTQATNQADALTGSKVCFYDNIANTLNSYSYMTKQGGIFSLFGNMKLLPPTGTTSTSTGPWINPRVFCTFLTPPPNTPLPLVSCVPYVEFPRYTSTMLGDFLTPARVQVYTNTVTLSSIPDVLVVFAKAAYRGQTQADSYIPISGVSVNFDNYSNLCSNYTQEDLYACSVAAGLDMDFSQFRGYARSNIGTVIPQYGGTFFDTKTTPSPLVQLTGSPVLLRMGQDIPLSSGLAPGTLGNYSVQVTLTLDNTNGFFSWLSQIPQASQNVSITIMGVNSGFFESCKGSSAIRKTILNTVDVESVSASTSVTATQLQRLVGGSGMRTSAGLTHSLAVPKFSPASSESGEPKRKYGRTLGSMIS